MFVGSSSVAVAIQTIVGYETQSSQRVVFTSQACDSWTTFTRSSSSSLFCIFVVDASTSSAAASNISSASCVSFERRSRRRYWNCNDATVDCSCTAHAVRFDGYFAQRRYWSCSGNSACFSDGFFESLFRSNGHFSYRRHWRCCPEWTVCAKHLV